MLFPNKELYMKRGKQLTFINPKRAGRKAIHAPSIRHRKRAEIKKPSSLHLTIKIAKNKAGVKNKQILKVLKRAILKGRSAGIRIIHFTLEYDHIHLLVEADCKIKLGRGMMRFGVTLAKGINHYRRDQGQVYKHRYHQRFITSRRDLKNVMNYIFHNGLKHRTATKLLNPYHSIRAEINYLMMNKKIVPDWELIKLLDTHKIFKY